MHSAFTDISISIISSFVKLGLSSVSLSRLDSSLSRFKPKDDVVPPAHSLPALTPYYIALIHSLITTYDSFLVPPTDLTGDELRCVRVGFCTAFFVLFSCYCQCEMCIFCYFLLISSASNPPQRAALVIPREEGRKNVRFLTKLFTLWSKREVLDESVLEFIWKELFSSKKLNLNGIIQKDFQWEFLCKNTSHGENFDN